MKNPKVSIIIPVKMINDELRLETLPAILAQSFQDFEVIILPDKKMSEKFPQTRIIPSWPKLGPADKRDIGVKKAKGEIIAFLDDDSYPEKGWLKNALKLFSAANITGVCGPSLTPPGDNLLKKVSGHVWSSRLGSGGAGSYRCSRARRREVNDFPSVNLLVRKRDFEAVGGFDSHFWPGEDTKLCHDLVYRLGKKIIYDPGVVVYHHRREVFESHLRQISRYALHRGHFAKILPKTSLRLGYFMPSFFVIGLIIGFWLQFSHPIFKIGYWSVIAVYLSWTILTAATVFVKEKNFIITLLLVPALFLTHVVYGIFFFKGLLTPKLKSKYQR